MADRWGYEFDLIGRYFSYDGELAEVVVTTVGDPTGTPLDTWSVDAPYDDYTAFMTACHSYSPSFPWEWARPEINRRFIHEEAGWPVEVFVADDHTGAPVDTWPTSEEPYATYTSFVEACSEYAPTLLGPNDQGFLQAVADWLNGVTAGFDAEVEDDGEVRYLSVRGAEAVHGIRPEEDGWVTWVIDTSAPQFQWAETGSPVRLANTDGQALGAAASVAAVGAAVRDHVSSPAQVAAFRQQARRAARVDQTMQIDGLRTLVGHEILFADDPTPQTVRAVDRADDGTISFTLDSGDPATPVRRTVHETAASLARSPSGSYPNNLTRVILRPGRTAAGSAETAEAGPPA